MNIFAPHLTTFAPQGTKAAVVETTGGGLQDPGWWGRFWARVRGRPFLEPGGDKFQASGDTTLSEAGESINEQSALRLSAFWACVGLRSDIVASLPLHLKTARKELAVTHPLYNVLHLTPNADMTSCEFFACVMVCLDIWGNSYAIIDRSSDGRVVALTPKNPQRMTVERMLNGRLRYTYRPLNAQPVVYDEDAVLHFRLLSIDGIVGLSPIEYAAEIMGDVIGANRAASREFRNGMKIGGFLQTPENVELSDAQRLKFEGHLQRYAQDPSMAGKWFLLEYGIKPISGETIRMNPRVSQLLETRYFGIEEICRILRTPPALIGHIDKASSWASSLESLNQGFLTYAIAPVLMRLEQRMRVKLLSADQRPDYTVRFNVGGLMRGNVQEQNAAYATALQNGWRCADEIRDFEDEPPLPDGQGKVFRVPANSQPADGKPQPPAGQPRQQ